VVTARSEEDASIARIRAGDAAAFDTLYLTYYRELWRFAYGLVRSRALAEEIVHDVFTAIWEGHARWTPAARLAYYLYRAVRNRAITLRRHERVVVRVETQINRRQTRCDPDIHEAGVIPGAGEPSRAPDVEAELAELTAALDRAIADLPERQRLALTLRVHHQLSYADIADVLGVSIPAATILVVRARATLRPVRDRFDAL
jgi:RNA polymerase sigma-70 factor (ECF subfamily)